MSISLNFYLSFCDEEKTTVNKKYQNVNKTVGQMTAVTRLCY